MIRRIVLQLLIAGVLFIGGLTVFQDRLLYLPETTTLPSLLAQAQRDGLHRWPAEGEFRGLLREAQGPARATLLLFHGNAGHAGHRAFYADLARFGLRVILAEYPGYGPRPGTPSETTLITDATETIMQAQREFGGITGAPIIVAGESIGAGVAAAAYARTPQAIAALWLITPWDSLVNVASHHYPWLPVSLLLRDRYDSAAHLASAQIPVSIVVAERDSVIPNKFGRHLFEQLRGPKRLWTVPTADHNDWPDHVDERWWKEVVDDLLKGLPPNASMIPSTGKSG